MSDKSFAKRYGGGAGMGIMVMGASYAVLGGAVLVFLGSVVSNNTVHSFGTVFVILRPLVTNDCSIRDVQD